jgi:hypothetical protein
MNQTIPETRTKVKKYRLLFTNTLTQPGKTYSIGMERQILWLIQTWPDQQPCPLK